MSEIDNVELVDWDKVEADEKNCEVSPYYHGDTVRSYLIMGAVVMLITLPIFRNLISMPLGFSLGAILIIGIAAGLTNPKYVWSAVINLIIAGAGLMIFEYYAVDAYARYDLQNFLFLVNQFLALDFLAALYYSVKTVRGMLVK